MNLSRPPRAPIPENVVSEFLYELKQTQCFEPKDIEWVESILTRDDNSDGYDQLTNGFVWTREDQADNIYAVCKNFNATKDKLTSVEFHDAKVVLRKLLWSKRVSMYKQQKVIVACPQRKQHPKYPTPNLHNWEGPGQHASAQLLAVYGLDYVQARTQCVKQAMSDADATHIMFVDDDVLIPRDALQRLLSYGLPSVAGVYPKKSPAMHGNATTSGEHPELIYSQQTVPIEPGNYTPVPATCVGGGMWLMALELFRRVPEPWFKMILGQDGKVVVGEDSAWVQRLAANGVTTHVVPGIIGIHVDFASGNQYAPPEIVDPSTKRVRPEMRAAYQEWPADLDLKELIAPDKVDWFGKNERLK